MTPLDKPVLFLATRDAKRSREFYEKVLGLEFVADEYPALVFRIGNSMLRIQKVERVAKAGYTALGWEEADIRKTAKQLRTAGVVFQRYEGMEQMRMIFGSRPAAHGWRGSKIRMGIYSR